MVKAINKTIGGCVEQRTLTDFNYDFPLLSNMKKGNASSNHSLSIINRRRPKPKAVRRINKGAFT